MRLWLRPDRPPAQPWQRSGLRQLYLRCSRSTREDAGDDAYRPERHAVLGQEQLRLGGSSGYQARELPTASVDPAGELLVSEWITTKYARAEGAPPESPRTEVVCEINERLALASCEGNSIADLRDAVARAVKVAIDKLECDFWAYFASIGADCPSYKIERTTVPHSPMTGRAYVRARIKPLKPADKVNG